MKADEKKERARLHGSIDEDEEAAASGDRCDP
jgi:hypothetical protein